MSEEKTLRDEFAMTAITGMLASDPEQDLSNELLAMYAFKIADAMMKVRLHVPEGE